MRFGLILTLMTAVAMAPAVASAESPSAPTPAPPAALTLEVLLVNDGDFPEVTPADAAAILGEARATLREKLGFVELVFDIKGEARLRDFLDRNVPPNDACAERLEAARLRPGKRGPEEISLSDVQRFLARWSVDELRSFFPESRRQGLSTYEEIAHKLMAELGRKLEMVRGFQVKSTGRSLLAPEKLDERSYVRWICAVKNQDEADLILTNAFIFYDLGTEPYPHTVFQKAKVGGASLRSPKRRAIRSRAVVASTFSMVTDIDFFREEGVQTLNARERLSVIGTFIVAHELGHAVFKLPDFYDHPRECLMTTKYETGYVSGYRDLKRFPGTCPKCQPYVDAKRHVFAADAARRSKRWGDAIGALKNAIRQTPAHVDGSRLRYLADLTVEIAEMLTLQGNRAEAGRWLRSALRRFPEHPAALRLDKELRASPATGGGGKAAAAGSPP